jgi:hypothetical protein
MLLAVADEDEGEDIAAQIERASWSLMAALLERNGAHGNT